MNKKGLRLLAKEVSADEKKKITEKVTNELFVHEPYRIRKEELRELKQSEEYKSKLKEELLNSKLYQDCVSFNCEKDSLLIKEYKKNEAIYDELAEFCEKDIRKAASTFKEEKEKAEIEKYDFEELARDCYDDLYFELVDNIKDYLLNEKITYKEFDFSDSWYFHNYNTVEVHANNIDEFLDYFEEIDENELLPLLGYENDWISGVLLNKVEEKNPELLNFKEISVWDYCDNEMCDIGSELYFDVISYFNRNTLIEFLKDNKYLKKELEKVKFLQEEILEKIPEDVVDLFPQTRRIKRKFYIHVGPTNSGKTYSSIERLKTAEKGIYLGPLRLLAYEQYEKLNSEGYPCTLYTGEEHQIIPFAKIQSSTIEMVDEHTDYDIAVIDEGQMLADKKRGWAWTKAILGLKAKEIHLCIAPYALNVCKNLIRQCGDEMEIVKHERQVPLIKDEEEFALKKKHIREKDAFIVFSRRNVHAITSELREWGIKCSMIYGNLPYDVRQEEARKFRDGETDVVVATDAIGMGMNLPIKRIVLLEISKFDGITRRFLHPAEIQQIVGRAGRQGMYEEGLWNSYENAKGVKRAVEVEIPQIEKVMIGLPEILINVEGKLSDIIREWKKIKLPEEFEMSELIHETKLIEELENITDNKNLIYKLATIPFDDNNEEIKYTWEKAVKLVINDEIVNMENLGIGMFPKNISLENAENLYKVYDLAYACIERFGESSESDKILKYKKKLSERISYLLENSKLEYRTCKYCGRKLAWNYPYGMCSQCHDNMYGRKYDFWDDFY